MDSNSYKFRIGKYAITDEKNPVGLTLNQVYSRHKSKNGNLTSNKDDLAHLFYNDENPVGKFDLKTFTYSILQFPLTL